MNHYEGSEAPGIEAKSGSSGSDKESQTTQPVEEQSLLQILRSGPAGHLPIPSRKTWRMRKPVRL